ncbi:MAG: hypothetical protein B1H40_00465 [Candidatus Latescibacteria bacterium 4484_181]|nr:MAG: hypothetical protein B1H40_00465 [Candidatus Latescibacteria bacterium 4484_181]RKY69253.1 MAG: hypothetical protein DRQ02_01655 [Candidatus Latescibacterota bacterium]RKY73757.1 MAG: hypothetical protein DRQ24_01690 [Candidatus Latescibacterota bacterium]
MKRQLAVLSELQKIDIHIDKLEKVKSEYPAAISAVEQQLEQSRKDLQSQRGGKEEAEKRRRHLERELEVASEHLKTSQQRLTEVKTNKEYEALQREIDVWKQTVSKTETEILKTMAEIEQLTEKIVTHEQRLKEEEKLKQKQISDFRAKLDSAEAELNGYRREREQIASKVGRDLLSHYERIRRGKGGVAVVSVSRRACGGCFKQLPPQKVVEIKKGNRLITCDSCGRILVWDESAK